MVKEITGEDLRKLFPQIEKIREHHSHREFIKSATSQEIINYALNVLDLDLKR